MDRSRLRSWTVAVVVAVALVAAACGDDGGAETADNTTSAPGAVATGSTTTVPPSTTSAPATTTAPTTTTTQAGPVSDTVFVTVDEMVLGWWDGSAWVETAEVEADVPPIEGETLRSVEGLPDVVAAEPVANCMPEAGVVNWWIDALDGLRASGTHDLQPRPYEEIGAADAHVDAIRAVLDAGGVDPAVPVEISRVTRFDIEGDGVDEVVIEAQRFPEGPLLGFIDEGHYSVVVLRRVLPDDSVENITLHAGIADLEQAGQYVLRVDSAGPIDVNGDGAYELASRWSYYEGGGASLFELGAEPAEVLVAGCGV